MAGSCGQDDGGSCSIQFGGGGGEIREKLKTY
jgi:hypothetical protein